jgi:LysM repeat protein
LGILGYNTYGVDGIFGQNTYNAVVGFQKAKGLPMDGIVGQNTKTAMIGELNRVSYVLQWGDSLEAVALKYGTTVQAIRQKNGISSWILPPGLRLLIPDRVNTAEPSRGGNRYGEMADWWTVASKVFAMGAVATITDLNTGLKYQVVRKGGSNHADCQPLTASDAATMKKIYGGEWSWARRAILVSVNGRVFAASQNGMPHGGQSIWDNNFPGHFCIHFLNSRTHGTNSLDNAHQAAVYKAAGLAK